MKREYKPGTLCYLNAKCGIPENVGKIVELLRFKGEIYGDRAWDIRPQSPLTMALQFGNLVVATKMSSEVCECYEYCMVPINDPDSEVDDATSEDKERTEVLQ